MKKLLFSLIAGFISATGSLIGAELILRAATYTQRHSFPPESNPYLLTAQERKDVWAPAHTGYMFHPTLGWIGKPHISRVLWSFTEYKSHVHSNEIGFFDDEFVLNTPKKRILVLGDSFTFPSGVSNDQAWPNVLEKKLLQNKVDVMNMSIGAFGTAQEYLAYQLIGRKYKPDLVIVAFQPLNDITDNTRDWSPLLGLVDGKLKMIRPPVAPAALTKTPQASDGLKVSVRIKDFLADHFLLYNQLKLLRNSSWVMAALVKAHLVETQLFHEYRIMFSQTLPEAYEKDWALTQTILLELKKQVEADGAEFVVLVLSIKEQSDSRTWAALQNQYVGSGMQWHRYGINTLLTDFLQKNHIRTIDTVGPLKKETETAGKSLYFPKDRHLKAEGHRFVAQTVYDQLKKEVPAFFPDHASKS